MFQMGREPVSEEPHLAVIEPLWVQLRHHVCHHHRAVDTFGAQPCQQGAPVCGIVPRRFEVQPHGPVPGYADVEASQGRRCCQPASLVGNRCAGTADHRNRSNAPHRRRERPETIGSSVVRPSRGVYGEEFPFNIGQASVLVTMSGNHRNQLDGRIIETIGFRYQAAHHPLVAGGEPCCERGRHLHMYHWHSGMVPRRMVPRRMVPRAAVVHELSSRDSPSSTQMAEATRVANNSEMTPQS